jgi:hypothetical protein
MKTFHPYHYL